jgi:hypothetical protein
LVDCLSGLLAIVLDMPVRGGAIPRETAGRAVERSLASPRRPDAGPHARRTSVIDIDRAAAGSGRRR